MTAALFSQKSIQLNNYPMREKTADETPAVFITLNIKF